MQCFDLILYLTLGTSCMSFFLFAVTHLDCWFISAITAQRNANSYQIVQETEKQDIVFICFNTKIPVDPNSVSLAIASNDNTVCWFVQTTRKFCPVNIGNTLKSVSKGLAVYCFSPAKPQNSSLCFLKFWVEQLQRQTNRGVPAFLFCIITSLLLR